MESIVISQKRFRAEIFYVFSSCLEVAGQIMKPWIDEHGSFCWTIEPWGYYESNNKELKPWLAPDEQFTTSISNDNPAFRSVDAQDMVNVFRVEFKKFKAYVEGVMMDKVGPKAVSE